MDYISKISEHINNNKKLYGKYAGYALLIKGTVYFVKKGLQLYNQRQLDRLKANLSEMKEFRDNLQNR
ncbi:MAG: hypothetical protein PHR06_10050 [Candidatus Cloacimonetes bacterium]|nr:hypothetical protein [Candidatus Cloacimonadota bacterium]